MFSRAVDTSHSDCLQSHTGFTSNYKAYCDKGKQLIEECDFDEDFDCDDNSDDFGNVQFRRRRRDSESWKDKIIDYSMNKTHKFIGYAEEKATDWLEKSNLKNLTSLLISKFDKYRQLFFSGSSFFEIGKSFAENCNQNKAEEVFGKFRAGGKREYMIKIVCGFDEKTNKSKAYISELKTEGCVYTPKNLRNKTGTCPVAKSIDVEACKKLTANDTCPYDYKCPGTQKCCFNGCGMVCQDPILKQAEAVRSGTTKTATTIDKYADYICTSKNWLRSKMNCLLKRKQCYADNQCGEGRRCCPTSCGNECLKLVPK